MSFLWVFGAIGLAVLFLVARFALLLKSWASPKLPPVPQPKRTGQKKTYSAEHPEVVIIGGGVVGGTMAIQFARQGRQVVLVERQLVAPERIVGEFLQPAGYRKMIELGIEDCIEGIDAVNTRGYVVYRTKDQIIDLPFPENPEGGRFQGRAFHNGPLLMKLREAAQKYPNVKIIEGNVTKLLEENGKVVGIKYTANDESKEIRAPLTLVSDGCFSKFRAQTCVPGHPKTISSNFVGVIVKDLVMPHEGCGHVMLIEPTPMLFYRISSTEVRALIDVPEPAPADVKEYIKTVTIPQLPKVLGDALAKAIEIPNNLRSMPNFRQHPAPLIREGVIVLGDALNIRHPLTGGGMTVAFSDISRLSPLLAEIEDFANTQDVMAAYRYFFGLRKPLASTINILAQALYRVFGQCSDDPLVSAAIRNACFGYFQLGGENINGPISLLSGIIESPWTLLYHYARVGFYGAYLFMLRPIVALKVLSAATSVFAPLMQAELGAEAKEM